MIKKFLLILFFLTASSSFADDYTYLLIEAAEPAIEFSEAVSKVLSKSQAETLFDLGTKRQEASISLETLLQSQGFIIQKHNYDRDRTPISLRYTESVTDIFGKNYSKKESTIETYSLPHNILVFVKSDAQLPENIQKLTRILNSSAPTSKLYQLSNTEKLDRRIPFEATRLSKLVNPETVAEYYQTAQRFNSKGSLIFNYSEWDPQPENHETFVKQYRQALKEAGLIATNVSISGGDFGDLTITLQFEFENESQMDKSLKTLLERIEIKNYKQPDSPKDLFSTPIHLETYNSLLGRYVPTPLISFKEYQELIRTVYKEQTILKCSAYFN